MSRINSSKSIFQKIIEFVSGVLIVTISIGGILGIISDASSLINLKVAITLTIAILIVSLLLVVWARLVGIKWVHNNTIVSYRQWNLRSWHIFFGVLLSVWIGPLINFSKESEKAIVDLKNPILKCGFSSIYNRDTLYVLVTRFEADVNKIETGCFGKALRDRIDEKANNLHIPIKICYSDSLYPQTHSEAKYFQKKYFADLVLWGDISNIESDCSDGDFCFYSQPSDSLIKTVDNKIEVETDIIKYQENVNPEKLREGEFDIKFSIKSYTFDRWLLSIYNIKIGNSNPDLYAIDESLNKIDLSEEYFQRSNLFFQFNKLEKAFEGYSKAIKINPNFAKAYSNRGDVMNVLGKMREALKDYDKALQIDVNMANTYSNRGTVKAELGDSIEAIKDFNKAIHFDNTLANAYYNRGSIIYKLGNKSKALQDYNQAIRIDSNFAEPYYNRGNLYSKLGNTNEAIDDYNKVLKINPNHYNAYIGRGIVKYILGNKTGALEDYNNAIKLNPNLIKAYYNRGNIKAELGDMNGALQDYTALIKINPNHKQAYNNRGNVFAYLGNKSAAINDFTKAISLNPNDVGSYNNRGNIKHSFGDMTGALQDYTKALQLDPNFTMAYVNRGNVKYDLNDMTGALQDYNIALQIDPNNANIYGKIKKTEWRQKTRQ